MNGGYKFRTETIKSDQFFLFVTKCLYTSINYKINVDNEKKVNVKYSFTNYIFMF